MTEKENNVRQAEINLKEAQAELRAKRKALDVGTRKAKAIFEEEVSKLADAIIEAQAEVDRESAWLAKAMADVEKPYTNSSTD